MAKQEITHESLQQKILQAEAELKQAQEEYKAFCKENPYELPKQPTVHELIKQRRKLSPDKPEDHAKANAAAAGKVAQEKLIAKVKAGE